MTREFKALLQAKLHPVFAVAAIVVAFICIGWLGFGLRSSLAGAPLIMQEIQAMTLDTSTIWNNSVAVTPAIDAQQPEVFETATFAVG